MAAFERSWRAELRRIPQAELEAEREYRDRELVEIEQNPGPRDGMVSEYSLRVLHETALSWIDQEIARRARYGTRSVRLAPRTITAIFAQELKRQVALEDFIVHRYPATNLKRSGRGCRGHCPF